MGGLRLGFDMALSSLSSSDGNDMVFVEGATEQKACLLSSYTCSLLRGVFNVLLSMITAYYLVEDMVQWSLICHIICHNTDFWSFFWRG